MTNEGFPSLRVRTLVSCAAAVPTALGLAGVLCWWSLRGLEFTEKVKGIVPMQLVTAIGVFLLGGGTVLLGFRRWICAAVCASGAVALGAATVLPPGSGDAAGIERLLVEALVPGGGALAARPAPNSSIALLLGGTALVISRRFRRTTASFLTTAVLASTTAAISAVGLAGYAMNLEGMYTWAEGSPLGFQATVSFLLVGAGLWVYSSIDPSTQRFRVPTWSPLPVAIGGFTATLCVWRTLSESRNGILEWLRSVRLLRDDFVDDHLPELTLAAGLVIVLLLTLAIYLGHKVSSRTAERGRALRQLRKAHDQLERRVKERTIEIASVNKELQAEIRSRKTLEMALRERAKLLADADRKKDQFLALLGHELRNPLATLSLGLKTMDLAGADESTLAETREVMTQRLAHIVRLVDDLLDVSRIRSGKITLRKATVDLRDVTSAAVRSLRFLARENGNTLSLSLPRAPVYVDADEARLEQIVSNLVSNAIKYTDRDGSVAVTARRETGAAVLRVRDTGIGIPEDVLPRVFDGSLDLSFERPDGGLGLGLMLVRRLVRMHGGTVEAFSDGTGKGSEFVVKLPAVAASEEADLPIDVQQAGSERSPGCRVLLVDDQADLVLLLRRLLEAWGHEVVEARDGPAALEVASRATPEVALIDIGLPGMSGYDLARHLRERTGGKTLLVAVTGFGQPEHRRRVRQAGFDHHLVKPVDFDVLSDLIDKAHR